MKVVMSINADAKEALEKNAFPSAYAGTFELYQHFVNRGHDVSFICPSEIVDSNGAVFQNEYKVEGNKLTYIGTNVAPAGDVFFMRGFGQDAESLDVTKRFFDSMEKMEDRFNLMINTPETAWYDIKDNQKKLDVPFIPAPSVRDISGLESSLNAGNRIVAKPNSGFAGRGIFFLDNAADARKYLGDADFGEYSFEHGVTGDEPRYIFFNGKPIVKRVLRKPEIFGVQNTIRLDVEDFDKDPEELEVARKVMAETGAFYGCVDFKGKGADGRPQVLEYNGSGTNQYASLDSSNPSRGRHYDLGERIVKEVERKVN